MKIIIWVFLQFYFTASVGYLVFTDFFGFSAFIEDLSAPLHNLEYFAFAMSLTASGAGYLVLLSSKDFYGRVFKEMLDESLFLGLIVGFLPLVFACFISGILNLF